ncbi:MAG TPA: hypothetical protein VK253_01420 [Candidatus Binatia bacterium]|nr:hypothetical protein [Candidatus Binatia bacterium]
MFRDRQQMYQRLKEIIDKFRQKGATSPEKAMTIQELSLPPRFEQAMNRRLGQLGIFVEVTGKYYLNEERLRQIQEERVKKQSGGGRRNNDRHPTWLRFVGILLMLPVGIIVAVALVFYFSFYRSYFPGEIIIILLIVALGLFVARLLFWRSRRRYWQGMRNGAPM